MFLQKADFERIIKEQYLDQLLDTEANPDTILAEVINRAIDLVGGYLKNRFNTDSIFATTGSGRPISVVDYCMHVATYLLNDRINPKLVPDKVLEAYNRTITELKDISKGNHSPLSLQPFILNDEQTRGQAPQFSIMAVERPINNDLKVL